MLVKERAGGLVRSQVLLVQVHPDSILQTDEHPSPLKVFPSSQRDVIIMPSPHLSLQVPVVES